MTRPAPSELKHSAPSLQAEAIVALLRAAGRLDWRLCEFMKPYGLSPTQFNCLRILRGAGPAGLTCSEIAERMINRDPDITRLVDRLEKRGLLKRSRESKDRRVIIVRIAQPGLDLLKTMDRPLDQFQCKLVVALGEPRLRSLIHLLAAVRDAAS